MFDGIDDRTDRHIIGGVDESPECAFLQLGDGRIAVGIGPFARSESPPESGCGFYLNSFGLEDPEPWRIPARSEICRDWRDVAELAGAAEATRDPPPPSWDDAWLDGFPDVFAACRDRIAAACLRKAVPALVERGNAAPAFSFRGLIRRLALARPSLRGYGAIGSDNAGRIGATPELLFESDGRSIESMALAGTVPTASGSAQLADDEKQLHEHRIVVEAIAQRLASVGDVEPGVRGVLDTGRMLHLRTPIRVTARGGETVDCNALIRLLHPTPAIGVDPRTPENAQFLADLRQRCGVPRDFGAPFGVRIDGRCEMVLAIRSVHRHADGALMIPAGCGIVAESELESERAELQLKCRSVKALFALAAT